MNDIYNKLIEILTTQYKLHSEDIIEIIQTDLLIDDLNFDTLDLLEITIKIEQEFNIKLNNNIGNLMVGELYEIISGQI